MIKTKAVCRIPRDSTVGNPAIIRTTPPMSKVAEVKAVDKIRITCSNLSLCLIQIVLDPGEIEIDDVTSSFSRTRRRFIVSQLLIMTSLPAVCRLLADAVRRMGFVVSIRARPETGGEVNCT